MLKLDNFELKYLNFNRLF